jgi:hypothetical protein
MQSANSYVRLSQEFVYAAKTGDEVKMLVDSLQSLDLTALQAGLPTDGEKKAFWINLYNGYTQAFLRQSPELYKQRNRFFKAKQIKVGGNAFSLDDIEHGILRRSKIKWSLGYLNKLFPGKKERALRVDSVDYRIHFALNCGARSCPPIAFYAPERLEQQLEMATQSYLQSEVEVQDEGRTVRLPAIMSWFRGDFGGKRGMRRLLLQHQFDIHPSARIRFKDYDWNLHLDNFKNL